MHSVPDIAIGQRQPDNLIGMTVDHLLRNKHGSILNDRDTGRIEWEFTDERNGAPTTNIRNPVAISLS
jgi:hypothetical protein